MTVDEYVDRLPSIHSMLQDNNIHSDVAFFLARTMFAHAINIKYDSLRKADPNYKKMSESMKQAKYTVAAQFVMTPDLFILLKFGKIFHLNFSLLFQLGQHAAQAADSKDMNIRNGKKEQERYTTLIEKLQDDKIKQEEHVEKFFAYFRQDKDSWFLSRSAKSAKNETITQFLQLCLFP